MHEASLHERNSFLTLTYDAEHLPADGNLDKLAVPEFIGRLRACRRVRERNPATGRFRWVKGREIRYYHCGEYGEKRKRPHYHVCLFGEDFRESRIEFHRKGSEFPEWVSSELSELWPFGQHLIGSLTFESAAYTARYVVDKVTGKRAELHYATVDPGTGEIVHERVPEFATMSLRPGIGARWFEKFSSDVYPSDECIVRGRNTRPPRYYDRLLERLHPEVRAAVESGRLERGFRKPYERSAARLSVREACAESRLNLHSQRELDL